MSGPIDITPEYKLAELLSDFTGREFSPAALLSPVHALLGLSEDDPRRIRLAETFWRAHDAVENCDWSGVGATPEVGEPARRPPSKGPVFLGGHASG